MKILSGGFRERVFGKVWRLESKASENGKVCKVEDSWLEKCLKLTFVSFKIRRLDNLKIRKFQNSKDSKVWRFQDLTIQKLWNSGNWKFGSLAIRMFEEARSFKNSKVRGFEKMFNIWKFECLVILLLSLTRFKFLFLRNYVNWCLPVCTNYVDVNRKHRASRATKQWNKTRLFAWSCIQREQGGWKVLIRGRSLNTQSV